MGTIIVTAPNGLLFIDTEDYLLTRRPPLRN